MAHVWFRRLPRGSGRLRGLRSGRCCRPRRALQRPSVSPAASSAGAAAAAAHARAAHCRLGEDGTHHQRAIEENSCWHATKASALQTQWPRRIDKACLRRPRPLDSSARRRARRAPRRARRHASGRAPGWARAGRGAWQQEPREPKQPRGRGEAGVRGMSRGSGERGGGVGSGSGGVGSGGVYRPTCGWAYHALPREGSSSSPVKPNCLSDASGGNSTTRRGRLPPSGLRLHPIHT